MNITSHLHRRSRALRLALLGLVAVLSLLAAACGDKPAPAPPKAAGPRSSTALEATLIVHPPDADGKRRAVVELQASADVASIDIAFTLPEACRTLAGARKRSLGALPTGQQKQSFIQFDCSEGATGDVTLSVAGQDASGATIDKQLASAL